MTKEEMANAGKVVAEALRHSVPDGYVVVFAVLKLNVEEGACGYIVGSAPGLRGGEESVRRVMQLIVDSEGEGEDLTMTLSQKH